MLAVVTATSKEMQSALGFAGAPAVAQGEVVEFSLGGHDLLLAVSGVGLVNSALASGRLLSRSDVTGAVNLGIAGAYDVEEFPLGSSCFVWQETWPEYGLLDEDGRVDPKGVGFPQGEVRGVAVWNRIQLNPVNDAEAMGLSLPASSGRAAGVTVSAVTGSADRAGWLKTACNGDVENMEGFALAFAVMQAGLPFLEVRTVSNLVGSRWAEDWDLKGALRTLGETARYLFTGK
jgi:futalosine nucleosidase